MLSTHQEHPKENVNFVWNSYCVSSCQTHAQLCVSHLPDPSQRDAFVPPRSSHNPRQGKEGATIHANPERGATHAKLARGVRLHVQPCCRLDIGLGRT
eukprot:459792-Amphidinium_carterae.1